MGRNTKVKRVTIKSNRSRCQREDDIKNYKKLKANTDHSNLKNEPKIRWTSFYIKPKKKKKEKKEGRLSFHLEVVPIEAENLLTAKRQIMK
jgi:hypothetical protein